LQPQQRTTTIDRPTNQPPSATQLPTPQGISDIITVPGLINVDFADVRAIMCNAGTAMLVGRVDS